MEKLRISTKRGKGVLKDARIVQDARIWTKESAIFVKDADRGKAALNCLDSVLPGL
jgi:hypothetical protein